MFSMFSIVKARLFLGILAIMLSFPSMADAEKNIFKSLLELGGLQSKSLELDIQASVDPVQVGRGERFRVYVDATMAPGWHIYSLHEESHEEPLATRLQIEENLFLPQGGWEESKPRLIMDRVQKKMVKTHEGMARFYLWQLVPEDLNLGKYPLRGSLVYRICDHKTCSLPKTLQFKTWVEVVEQR